MSIIERFNKLGFFQNLALSISQTREQGFSKIATKAILDIALKVSPGDIDKLRKVIAQVLEQSRAGENSVFDYFIDQYWGLQNEPVKLQNFKTYQFRLCFLRILCRDARIETILLQGRRLTRKYLFLQRYRKIPFCLHRGKVSAKNKGEIDMYLVKGVAS
jgi:hypothetical protein